MLKASPVEMRKALETVSLLKNSMVLFVPMPVISGDDYMSLKVEMLNRMDKLADIVEGEKP